MNAGTGRKFIYTLGGYNVITFPLDITGYIDKDDVIDDRELRSWTGIPVIGE